MITRSKFMAASETAGELGNGVERVPPPTQLPPQHSRIPSSTPHMDTYFVMYRWSKTLTL